MSQDKEKRDKDISKEWLFKENIRLKKWSEDLTNKEKQLDEEKKSFELQKKALEIGFKKLAADKEAFHEEMKREKAKLSSMRYEAEKSSYDEAVANNKRMSRIVGPGFFCGVTGLNSLKKRYKELLKIYHPDNKYGDSFTVACINKEYELLKEKMSAKKN